MFQGIYMFLNLKPKKQNKTTETGEMKIPEQEQVNNLLNNPGLVVWTFWFACVVKDLNLLFDSLKA